MPFSPTTIGPDKKPGGPTEAQRVAQIKKQSVSESALLEEERIYRQGVVSIKDLIAPAAFKVDPGYVQLGNVLARTIFVVTYPRYITVGWSSPVIMLNTALDIGMFFYPVPAAIILKQIIINVQGARLNYYLNGEIYGV